MAENLVESSTPDCDDVVVDDPHSSPRPVSVQEASPQPTASDESSPVADRSSSAKIKPRVRNASDSEDSKLQADMTELFQAFLEEIRDELLDFDDEEVYFVDIWDFAGQDSFAAVQHMLLADLRCAYAAVFDVSLALEARADPTFCKNSEELKISGHDVTNFDVLEGWLNIIHQVSPCMASAFGKEFFFMRLLSRFLNIPQRPSSKLQKGLIMHSAAVSKLA